VGGLVWSAMGGGGSCTVDEGGAGELENMGMFFLFLSKMRNDFFYFVYFFFYLYFMIIFIIESRILNKYKIIIFQI
jgi:hypothetical protein